MSIDQTDRPAESDPAQPTAPRVLSPAAQRALAEAAERRAILEREHATATPEVGGQAGPDPVRYGDWENKGIVSDF